MKPFFQITLSATGADISAGLSSVNISLTINETAGGESDTVTIVVDDKDGGFGEPEVGTKIQVVAGYDDGNHRDFGVFSIEEVTDEGWPSKISISARSVDVMGPAKAQKTQGFPKKDYPTYGDVFGKVAADAGLSLAIAPAIASKANEYVGQSGEDPVSFATRIGEKLNAAVCVKSGRLVVAEKRSGQSISGTPLTTINVVNGLNALTYSRSRHGKTEYSSVKATWMDRKDPKMKEVTSSTGKNGPEFLIRTSKQNEEDAQSEADAKAKELAAGQETATFSINGEPSATAGAPVKVEGIKSTIDGEWISKSVTHEFQSDAPYTTSVECERKA